MDPWRQAALWAREALLVVRRRTVTRLSIDLAGRKLLTLRLVTRKLLEGELPGQINVAAIDVGPMEVSADVPLEDALNSLVCEAVVHAGADIVLMLYGAVHRPDLLGTLWWEVWRDTHAAAAEHVRATTQLLRHVLAQFKAFARAADRAATYPHMSPEWITLMLAAEQHARNARIDVEAASSEASQMGLAISVEHGSARELLADGDV